MLNDYNSFKLQVSVLVKKLYGLTLNDIDINSLITAYQEGFTPDEYVESIAEKFDLIKIDLSTINHKRIQLS